MSDSSFATAYTIQDVQQALASLNGKALVFVDVDDTLITPASHLFRHSSPYRSLIDDLKASIATTANFETILSQWRLNRKSILVNDAWPSLINTLKKSYATYALTKMETGSLGDIPSMEQWRYGELMEKGISFTPTFLGEEDIVFMTDDAQPFPPTFYKGIFMTGSYHKGDVFRLLSGATDAPPAVALIDDRPAYLEDMRDACRHTATPFLGILFKGVELIPGAPDPKTAAFQKQQLLENGRWFEDDEVNLA